MSHSLLVTYTQNNLGISHRIPAVRRNLVLHQLTIGESQEIIDSLINQLVSRHYIQ
jgi:hypothetical protein